MSLEERVVDATTLGLVCSLGSMAGIKMTSAWESSSNSALDRESKDIGVCTLSFFPMEYYSGVSVPGLIEAA